jgi:hypothetical protein
MSDKEFWSGLEVPLKVEAECFQLHVAYQAKVKKLTHGLMLRVKKLTRKYEARCKKLRER